MNYNGSFRVVEEVGRGSYGTVKLIQDVDTKKKVFLWFLFERRLKDAKAIVLTVRPERSGPEQGDHQGEIVGGVRSEDSVHLEAS